jgi:ParB-like chromosome segregation protein Spo0J
MESSEAAPSRADRIASQRWAAAQLLAFGWSEREVGYALGKSRAYVRKYGRPLVPQVMQRAEIAREREEAAAEVAPPRHRNGHFAKRDHRRLGHVLGVFTA